MFGIFTGTIVNAILVIAGTAMGCLFKGEKLKTIGDRVFQGFGLFTVVLGVSGALNIDHPLLELASLVIGTAIGEAVDLDDKFNRLGNFFQNRFSKGDDRFASSFISGALLFCVGSMSIMGALESGLENQHSIYYTKAVLDCVSASLFAMGGGVGVCFAAIVVILYQGGLTALASLLQPIMIPEIVTLSVAVGSLSLIGLGLNMLGITRLKVANFLPTMFVPIVYQAIVIAFGLKGII